MQSAATSVLFTNSVFQRFTLGVFMLFVRSFTRVKQKSKLYSKSSKCK